MPRSVFGQNRMCGVAAICSRADAWIGCNGLIVVEPVRYQVFEFQGLGMSVIELTSSLPDWQQELLHLGGLVLMASTTSLDQNRTPTDQQQYADSALEDHRLHVGLDMAAHVERKAAQRDAGGHQDQRLFCEQACYGVT